MRSGLLRLGWLPIVAILGMGCRTTTVFRYSSRTGGWEATFPGERVRNGWSSQLIDTGTGVVRIERGVTTDVRLDICQVLALEQPELSADSRLDLANATALLAIVREKISGVPNTVLKDARQLPLKEHVVASEELRYRTSVDHQVREYAARVVVSEAGVYLAIAGWEQTALDSEWVIKNRQERIAKFLDSLIVRVPERVDASHSAAPGHSMAALAEGLKHAL